MKRHLRVAFTAAELRFLEDNPEFAHALATATDTPESLKELVMMGGAILQRRDQRKGSHPVKAWRPV